MAISQTELEAIKQFVKKKTFNVYQLDTASNECLLSVEAYTVPGMLAQLPLLLRQTIIATNNNFLDENTTIKIESQQVDEDKWYVAANLWDTVSEISTLIECIVVMND